MHRGFPGKIESSTVSRDNVSREIGRNSAGCMAKRTAKCMRNQVIIRFKEWTNRILEVPGGPPPRAAAARRGSPDTYPREN